MQLAEACRTATEECERFVLSNVRSGLFVLKMSRGYSVVMLFNARILCEFSREWGVSLGGEC